MSQEYKNMYGQSGIGLQTSYDTMPGMTQVVLKLDTEVNESSKNANRDGLQSLKFNKDTE